MKMKMNREKLSLLLIFMLQFAISTAQAPAIAWQECIGSDTREVGSSFEPTADGGYILAGTKGAYGSYDYYVVKLDPLGAIQWEKVLGDQSNDQAMSIKQTTDGGYIVLGDSYQTAFGLGTNKGFWIFKLDASGEQQWNTVVPGGGTGINQNTYDIRQTSDGGYVFTGVRGFVGKGSDFYIVKLDSAGAITWQKNYGGSAEDYPNAVRQTTDGGYIVAGQAYSNDVDVSGQHGDGDVWIIKLNPLGELEWQKAYGGPGVDYGYTVELTSDGGYIAGGFAVLNGGDVSGAYGNADFWILKLSATGTLQWQKAYGGDIADKVRSIKQTSDGGYIAAGYTTSNNSGYVTGHHGSGLDSWVVKLNSTGALQWQKALGGTGDDNSAGIIQNDDGSYITAGSTASNNGDVSGNHGSYDMWVVKLNPETLQTQTFEQNRATYPNPTSGILNIKITDAIEKVVVTDLTGKKVMEQDGPSTQIDVHNLQTGVYLIQISSGQKLLTEKFLKR